MYSDEISLNKIISLLEIYFGFVLLWPSGVQILYVNK